MTTIVKLARNLQRRVDEWNKLLGFWNSLLPRICARALNEHRAAIEAGDEVLLCVAIRLCEQFQLDPPDWLRDAGYKAYCAGPSNTKGKYGAKAKALRLFDALSTYWTYQTIRQLHTEKQVAYPSSSNAMEVTARVLGLSEGAIDKRIQRARRFTAKGQAGAFSVPRQNILDELPREFRY